MSVTLNYSPKSTDVFGQPAFNLNTPIAVASTGIAGAVLALAAAYYFVRCVLAENEGNERMRSLRLKIFEGARAYLLTQYKWLTLWGAVMFILISLVIGLAGGTSGTSTGEGLKEGFFTGLCFLIGSVFSATAGYWGMLIATQANSRTTEACRGSISKGLQVSFASGAVMGFSVVGLGLVGLSALYLIFTYGSQDEAGFNVFGVDNGQQGPNGPYTATYTWAAFSGVFNRLAGFGFGASTIGMFARVGGGVFTKAADVGSDLVGKVEQGIPEDDPRNPAVIADNVGDNVGDVAGMGADLFESYAGAVIATATLAPRFAADNVSASFNFANQSAQFQSIMSGAVALPYWINGWGILASLIGTYYVRNTSLGDATMLDKLLNVIMNGVIIATVFTTGASAFCVWTLFSGAIAVRLFFSIFIGLLAGVIISKFTEFCTAYEYSPTQNISAASEFGPAPVIIKGLGVGMMSVSVPAFTIGITIIACNALSGQYGVAISAVGLLSTLGITLATDAYGPVADNAGGIAEMAHLEPFVRSRTDKLDSLGNTTAATGKGLAIASATLTAVGLIAAFVEQSGLVRIGTGENLILTPADYPRILDLSDAVVLTGILLGACLPYIFAALTMLSVDRGARAIITEVRLQFATAPLLMKGSDSQTVDGVTYPDSTRCVAIATEAAIQEMVLPGVLAVFVPIVIGFLLGPKGTVGLLAGGLGGCFMLALTMATTGGAWDNAKKWCEKCASEGEVVNGELTYTFYGVKSSEVFDEATLAKPGQSEAERWKPFLRPGVAAPRNAAEVSALKESLERLYHDRHAPTVCGDTVGDPFKDTSGPALNVLIKTMTMMALMLAPAYNQFGEWNGFGKTGCSIAAGLAVVVGTISFFLVRHFRRLNDRRNAISVQAKKEADAKYLATGATGAYIADESSGAAESGNMNDPLIPGRR